MELIKTMKDLQAKWSWTGKLAGVLPTFYDETTKESQVTLKELREKFERGVLDPIHRATIFREAAAYGQTLFELDKSKSSRAAQEYQNLIDHIVRITK